MTTSLFFELAMARRRCFNTHMGSGYGQFCPIAKASEIFATRWTPLILRELMYGEHNFNDIHRGVPLISRALLVERLRQLEEHGVIEKRARPNGSGGEYWLTPAGEALRDVVKGLARWGHAYTRDRLTTADLNPGLLMWRMRKRVDINALREQRVVVRFEFSGVPKSRTKLRIMWLVLERTGVDVCVKDPGFPVDLIVRGDLALFVRIYLGHTTWQEAMRKALQVEGDRRLTQQLPVWLQLDKTLGREYLPLNPPAA